MQFEQKQRSGRFKNRCCLLSEVESFSCMIFEVYFLTLGPGHTVSDRYGNIAAGYTEK